MGRKSGFWSLPKQMPCIKWYKAIPYDTLNGYNGEPFGYVFLMILNMEERICIMEMREKILTFIEKNSRIGLKDLAIMLGVEETTVAQELAAMEQERIICGYPTLVDWEKTSIEKVNALIEVRVTPQRGRGFDSVAERIYNYPEVNAVYLISGGYDLLVTLEGKTLREVAQFVSDKLSTLDSVLSTKTNFILKKYKDYGMVIAKPQEDERMLVSL